MARMQHRPDLLDAPPSNLRISKTQQHLSPKTVSKISTDLQDPEHADSTQRELTEHSQRLRLTFP